MSEKHPHKLYNEPTSPTEARERGMIWFMSHKRCHKHNARGRPYHWIDGVCMSCRQTCPEEFRWGKLP